MPRIPLTRIATFSPFPHFLQEGGFQVERLLTSMGVAPESLLEKERLFPFEQGCSFIDAVVKQTGMPQIGLDVGARTSMRDLGAFGIVLSQSLTLHDLLRRLTRLMPMVNSGARTWIEDGSSPDVVVLRHKHENVVQRANIDGFGLFVLIDAVRMATGAGWRPKKAWLDAVLGDVSRFEALSEARVVRETDEMGFEIPRALLSTPLIFPKSRAATSAPESTDLQERRLRETAPARDFIGNITQTIRSGMGTQIPTIEQSAALAGISVRTLQRRLGAKGWGYRELVDRVRYREAIRLLEGSDASMMDIARCLGYADAANFSHACQRWTGISPSEYRRQLRLK